MSAQRNSILLFFMLHSMFNNVYSLVNHCCRENIFLPNEESLYCEDRSPTNLTCGTNEIRKYDITGVSPDEDVYWRAGFQKLENYSRYCVGQLKYARNGQHYVYVVQYCGEEDEATTFATRVTREESRTTWMSIVVSSIIIMNVISLISTAITVYLYFWLPNLQDVHGTCVFHLALNIGLLHAIVTYDFFLKTPSILPESFCLIEMNVIMFIIFSVYCWSIILSYNTWIQVKGVRVIHTVKRLNRYRLFGYGTPLILGAIVIIAAPLYNKEIYFQATNIFKCVNVLGIYVVWPTLIVPFINFYFFIDSQRKLWSLNGADTSIERKNKFKMYLNLKLFLMMNVPFAIFLILLLLLESFEVPSYIIIYVVSIPLVITAASEGFLIFLATVLCRKRVITGFIKYGQHSCASCLRPCVPQSLRTMKDDEATESETDTDMINEEDGVVPG